MYKKSPAELERAKIIKATRTLVRLKHSLKADEEINSLLPDRLAEFDAALQQGSLLTLRAGLEEVLDANS